MVGRASSLPGVLTVSSREVGIPSAFHPPAGNRALLRLDRIEPPARILARKLAEITPAPSDGAG